MLQRWAWGRQRGVAFSSPSFFPFFPAPVRTDRSKLPESDFKKKEKKRNQKKKEQIDYPVTTTQNIQKSARFSFRVVWFVHAPVTHPTLQPSLTVSIIFLFISIYFRFFLSFSLRLFFCCIFSVAYSPTFIHRDARIISPCAHARFYFSFWQIDFAIRFSLVRESLTCKLESDCCSKNWHGRSKEDCGF